MTKKLNLCLHCGANEVSLEDVNNCPVGDPLGSRHYPVAHGVVIENVRRAADDYGFEIVNEAHALSHENNRYFGLMQIAPRGSDGASLQDYSWVLGLRNSHDQSFPIGLAGGAGVFVCDNLSFLGEIKLRRKHTRYAMNDLPRLVSTAFGRVVEMKTSMDTRFDAYRDAALDGAEAKAFVFDAVRTGVVTRQQMLDLWREWEKPSHEDFAPRTVWSMFNCVTETLKERLAAPVIAERTTRLHLLADSASGVSALALGA